MLPMLPSNKVARVFLIITFFSLLATLLAVLYNNFITRNISISEPLGYYLKLPVSNIERGNRYLLCVYDEPHLNVMHKFGLPKVKNECVYGAPYILKQVAGMPNDEILVTESGILINGLLQKNSKQITIYKNVDLLPLPIGFHKQLESDEYFVLGVTTTSYDSRYFGTIRKGQFYKRVILLMNND